MTLTMTECELLAWDSKFFGARIGRVREGRLTAETGRCVDSWAQENDVDCIYLLAQADDLATIGHAREHGYDLVDIRLTFECPELSGCAVPSDHRTAVRPVRLTDLPTLQQIARAGYRDTRFFSDHHFSASRAEELYSTWITLECEGRADQVLVAESAEHHPVGYISCSLDVSKRSGQIGLVGVSGECRGQGVGTFLVLAALEWFHTNGADRAIVITQGRNIAAQRLYQRCGFITQNVQLWYHKWFCQQADAI